MKSINKDTLRELEKSLTSDLKEKEAEALAIASVIMERDVSLQSFHGYIGGKNNMYVDSIRSKFPSPDDFVSRWLQGMFTRIREVEENQKSKYQGNVYPNSTSHNILRLLKNNFIKEYFLAFLKRNFYRNFKERTREKAKDIHWKLWFGENQIPWGLIIAPAFRNGEWTNDVSEIRRADYQYWTIEHVLNTGLIDPDSNAPIYFRDLGELIIFYRSVLKRLSRSQYEKQIVDLYLEYLERSESPLAEPFLVPELRYAGLEISHKYRLDFAMLNPHVMEFVGFELSPHSTHMAVTGIKGKKQKEVNQEIKTKWSKEISKRNEYFLNYDITTITFTDEDLEDMEKCFKVIKKFLQKRPTDSKALSASLKELEEYEI